MHHPATQPSILSSIVSPKAEKGDRDSRGQGWAGSSRATVATTVLYPCEAPEFSSHCVSSRKNEGGITPSEGTGHTSSFGVLESCLSHHFLFGFQLLCAITGSKPAGTSAKSLHHAASQRDTDSSGSHEGLVSCDGMGLPAVCVTAALRGSGLPPPDPAAALGVSRQGRQALCE